MSECDLTAVGIPAPPQSRAVGDSLRSFRPFPCHCARLARQLSSGRKVSCGLQGPSSSWLIV